MALPSTGAISLLNVRTELGKTGAISLGDSAVRTLAGRTSGAISLGDLRGKSNGQDVIIKSGYKPAQAGKKEYYDVFGFSTYKWSVGSASPTYIKINSSNISILRFVYYKDVREYGGYSSKLVINMLSSSAPSSITIEINKVKYTSTSKGAFFDWTEYIFPQDSFSFLRNQTNHTIKFLI